MSKFRFKPNKKMGSDGIEGAFDNGTRADRADQVLDLYCKLVGCCADFECKVTDLIGDLGHYCDREKQDFEQHVRCGKDNWEAER